MATLFEMTNEARALYELLQADEIDAETFEDTLESIGVEQKLESYCQIIRQYEADAALYLAEADRVNKKARQAENNAKRMKGALLAYMQSVGKDKDKAGTFSVSISSFQAVNVYNEADVPEQYFVPQEPKISKTLIRDAIKAGEEVPGAEMVTNLGVRIR